MSHLGAVSLLVRDYGEAIAFFVGKLGFELSEDTDMGGAKAPTTVEESVTGMRRVIDALTPAEAGSFLNWKGGNYPW